MLNKVGTMKIETQRLVLREFRLSDAEDMFSNWVTDDEVCKFYTWNPHINIEETKSFLNMLINEYKNPLTFNWVIIDKESNQAIGTIYLSDVDEQGMTAVINCIISKKYWNRGIAPEATRAVISYSFSNIKLKCINAHHHENNVGSGKALTKSGMIYLGDEYREYPECTNINGIYRKYTISE
ncbi:MAG: GNAT family N-acetyltransferase [Oscillospiraceae bacterium]|jgi:RimJ/RimL family protein N-acetyltransferase|nr:GNAT family N-acetyltransferase [Oscillospiraceae bacterium]